MVNKTPDSLVKFCDTVTAEKILTSQALRWSAPHLFIDPFELNHQSQLSFTPNDLLNATVQYAVNLIFSSDQPVGSTPMLQAIRRWRSEDRFASPEEAQNVLSGLLLHMVAARQEYNQRFMENWRNYCLRLRICCFTSRLDNPLAWKYFGDAHRGVGLRFRCGESTSFHNPQKVTYQDSRPEISLLNDEVAAVVNNIQDEHGEAFTDKFLTKARALAHEREWRCFDVISERAQAQSAHNYTDRVFNGADLKAICLGIQTPAHARAKLTQLALNVNPKVQIYQSGMQTSSYNIHFVRKTAAVAKDNSAGPEQNQVKTGPAWPASQADAEQANSASG